MHLIAMKLKEETGIPWIADFRDPWTQIDFYDDLHLSPWADCKQHKLEHQVLTKASKVVTVSWDCARELGRLGNRNVRVIPNGYDWDLEAQSQNITLSEKFTITHLGVITPSRNAPTLWQALQELKAEIEGFDRDLSINLIGQVDQSVVRDMEKYGLTNNTQLIPHVPHDEVLRWQKSSQMLLLLVNNTPNAKGILTGKLFEYLASRRPILCIGPEDGDATHLIAETMTGITIGFEEKEKMKEAIKSLYQRYLKNDLPNNESTVLEQYSRKVLAEQFGRLLDKTTV